VLSQRCSSALHSWGYCPALLGYSCQTFRNTVVVSSSPQSASQWSCCLIAHLCHFNTWFLVTTSALAVVVYACLASPLLQDYYPDQRNPLTLPAPSYYCYLVTIGGGGGGDAQKGLTGRGEYWMEGCPFTLRNARIMNLLPNRKGCLVSLTYSNGLFVTPLCDLEPNTNYSKKSTWKFTVTRQVKKYCLWRIPTVHYPDRKDPKGVRIPRRTYSRHFL
jgi:hypothetical protein